MRRMLKDDRPVAAGADLRGRPLGRLDDAEFTAGAIEPPNERRSAWRRH
jgi:hypothetical protein